MSVDPTAAERALLEALRGLRYGSVEAIVHDGRIQRIERHEKLRIEPDPDPEGIERRHPDTHGTRPDRRSSPEHPDGGEP